MKVVAVPQNMNNAILKWTNAHFWVFVTLKLSYKCTQKSESRKLTYTLRNILAFQNRKNKYYCGRDCKAKEKV